MKKIYFIIPILFIFSNLFGQVDKDERQLNEKQKVLEELDNERSELDFDLSIKIQDIDTRLLHLDTVLLNSQSSNEKIISLIERVKVLEEKQSAIDQKTFNVYNYNYSSAIVNLASMEREIKPLILFNSTKDFFNTLEDVGNPMGYEGYDIWFKEFQKFISDNKDKEATLNALSHILDVTGDLTKGTPFTGTVASSLFEGISLFVNSIKNKKKKLRETSMHMLKLTAIISQFTHDKNLIETEYTSINKSLEELNILQDEAILENFVTILGKSKNDLEYNYTEEMDATKRFEYIKSVISLVETKIEDEQKSNPEKWKEKFYTQMMEVQSLKIRFGTITFRILENINKYESLISKYKNDPYIGERVEVLESKLFALEKSFESTFNPQEYIKAANVMYVID